MGKLVDVVWAVIELIKWALLEKKRFEISKAVGDSESKKDQSPVEAELDHMSLGHTTAHLASVSVDAIKDHSKHRDVESGPVQPGAVPENKPDQ